MEDESLGKSRRLLHLPGVSSVGLSAPALAPVLFHFEITFQVPQGKAQANWLCMKMVSEWKQAKPPPQTATTT
ncbi:hypothetical protein Bca4012_075942 [Brassica carinata]|uniref:Uncharacterized protein n=1 Tax=Brassica oleracea TaxID=3712 RepID=A0A3P6EJC4_BRAOL|nr:unnamed protein product [Brassica oleracea]